MLSNHQTTMRRKSRVITKSLNWVSCVLFFVFFSNKILNTKSSQSLINECDLPFFEKWENFLSLSVSLARFNLPFDFSERLEKSQASEHNLNFDDFSSAITVVVTSPSSTTTWLMSLMSAMRDRTCWFCNCEWFSTVGKVESEIGWKKWTIRWQIEYVKNSTKNCLRMTLTRMNWRRKWNRGESAEERIFESWQN